MQGGDEAGGKPWSMATERMWDHGTNAVGLVGRTEAKVIPESSIMSRLPIRASGALVMTACRASRAAGRASSSQKPLRWVVSRCQVQSMTAANPSQPRQMPMRVARRWRIQACGGTHLSR